jgi:hypothetical protein
VDFLSAWLLLLGIPLLQATENRGFRIKIQNDQAGLSNQRTIYLLGDRKRVEFRNASGDGAGQTAYGPRLVSITRCDLGQSFELNLDASEYTSRPYPPEPLTPEELRARGLHTPLTYVSDKPTLRIEVTTVDTGERKKIFGYVARRVITTRKQTPLEGSSSSQLQESVTDGWYIDAKPVDSDSDIDLHQRLSCDRKWAKGKQGHSYLRAVGGNRSLDRPEFVSIGEAETGFALQSVMTSKSVYTLPDGTRKQSDSKLATRVVELEEGPLDPALFEIPPGFKQVDQIERSPAASAFASQPKDFWQRVRISLTALFNRQ